MPTSKGAICFEFTNYQRTNNQNDFHRVWWLSQLTNCTFQKLFEHLELVVIFLRVQNYDLHHIPSISITLENLKILCANFQNIFVIFCAKYSRFIFIKNSNEANGCSCTGLMRKNGLTLHFKFEETAILNLNFSQIKELKFLQKNPQSI